VPNCAACCSFQQPEEQAGEAMWWCASASAFRRGPPNARLMLAATCSTMPSVSLPPPLLGRGLVGRHSSDETMEGLHALSFTTHAPWFARDSTIG